jgi:hypothetical protein
VEQASSQYDYSRPWQSNEERLTGIALMAVALMPADAIRAIRPPIPRIATNPPRFGLPDRGAIGIADIIDMDQLYPGARIDYSGSNSGYSGSTAGLSLGFR